MLLLHFSQFLSVLVAFFLDSRVVAGDSALQVPDEFTLRLVVIEEGVIITAHTLTDVRDRLIVFFSKTNLLNMTYFPLADTCSRLMHLMWYLQADLVILNTSIEFGYTLHTLCRLEPVVDYVCVDLPG